MRVEQFSLGGVRGGAALHVGLVNNMPDALLRATELQFARLLKDAAGGRAVRLSLFSLSGVPRSAEMRARMEGFYADAVSLPAAGLDALIVTGAEPCEGDMRREPWWQPLAALIDGAKQSLLSTIYCGSAARAAVLHLDGIAPVFLKHELFGVLGCERVQDDPLFRGMAAVGAMPQVRRQGLAEDALLAQGYKILTRVIHGDPDIFLRPGPGQTLFLQGHPEYDADSFARRFLRETERFLRSGGRRPNLPEGYFDRATEDMLYELAAQAVDADFLPRYEAVVNGAVPLHTWRSGTVRLFGNWLSLAAGEKSRRAVTGRPPLRRKVRA